MCGVEDIRMVKNFNHKLSLFFFLLLASIFLIYPWWILILDFTTRLVVFTLLFFFCVSVSLLLNKVLSPSRSKSGKEIFGLFDFSRKEVYIMVASFIILLLAQGYAMTMSSELLGDEVFHISKGLYFFFAIKIVISRALSFLFSWTGALTAAICLSLIILIFVIRRRISGLYQRFIPRRIKKVTFAFLFLFGLFLFLAYFFIVDYFVSLIHAAQFGGEPIQQSHFAWLVRFPPIGTILASFSYLFGYNIVVVRLLQTIFYFLSAVLLYKICLLFRSKEVAFFAAALLVVVPGYFEYGHMAYMEPGVVFFILLSSYFFLRYLKDRDPLMGILSSVVAMVGFYYKDPLLFLFPIFYVAILWEYYSSKFRKGFRNLLSVHRQFLLSTMIAIISIFPWLVISKKYNLLQYLNLWDVSALLRLDGLLYYSTALYHLVIPVLFLLFMVSIIYCLFKVRDSLTRFSIAFIAVWYLIFTSYYLTPRLIVPAIPFVLIIMCRGGESVLKRFGKRTFSGVFALLLLGVFLSSLWLTYHGIEDRFYHVDEAYRYMGENLPPDSRLHISEGIYNEFYVKKYGLNNLFSKYNDFLEVMPEGNISRFHQTLVNKDVDYFLFFSSADILPQFFDFRMIEEIDKDSSFFSVVQRFRSGNNTLTLVKVS